MKKYGIVGWIAWLLVVVGGINWGLVGIDSNYNVVAMFFVGSTLLTRSIYMAIGLAALVVIYYKIQCLKNKN
jgi:uncharacterized membrane protein YuzA (DUF378 family)